MKKIIKSLVAAMLLLTFGFSSFATEGKPAKKKSVNFQFSHCSTGADNQTYCTCYSVNYNVVNGVVLTGWNYTITYTNAPCGTVYPHNVMKSENENVKDAIRQNEGCPPSTECVGVTFQ